MTFSIVACDPGEGDLGRRRGLEVPVRRRVVPWAKAGVGAVATQARANADYGPDGLGLLAGGMSAAEAVAR